MSVALSVVMVVVIFRTRVAWRLSRSVSMIANEDNVTNVNNVTVCLLLTDKATAVKGEKTKKSKNAPAEMPSNKPVRR